MLNSNVKLEQLINEMRKNGNNIPKIISEIPKFPFDSFDVLIDSVNDSTVRILRHTRSMNPSVFSILANGYEKLLNLLGNILFWGGIPISIGLGYFISWWFLALIIITYLLGSKLIASSYNSAVFRSASSNEMSFCFLYFIGHISVGFPDSYDIHFYQEE